MSNKGVPSPSEVKEDLLGPYPAKVARKRAAQIVVNESR